MHCYSPVIRLVNLVLVAPVTVIALYDCTLPTQKNHTVGNSPVVPANSKELFDKLR